MIDLDFKPLIRRVTLQAGACCVLVLLAGCAAPIGNGLPECVLGPARDADIDDVVRLAQEITPYARAAGERLEIGDGCRNELLAEFRERFYSPWTQKSSADDLAETKRLMKKVAKGRWYGVNRRLMPAGMLNEILENCALAAFPSRDEKSIAIVPTHLRGLPTHLPLFTSANGYPFDMLQYPQVKANEPLRVLHASRDGIWLFVETAYSNGWLEARDVAFADQEFIDSWMALPQLVITLDNTKVTDGVGGISYRAGIGTFLPLDGAGDEWWKVKMATAGKGRKAVSSVTRIARNAAERFPLAFNRENISLIGNQLIGQPYGWGEIYGLRDCSAMLRDFFMPFGIWLPRTSADQIASTPQQLKLSGKQPREKEEAIRRQAVPFLTLFYKPGHIMLYIGSDPMGGALVFHNAWSLRIKDGTGERLQSIGKAVVTTLEPGKELGVVNGKTLLEELTSMARITDRCTGPQTPSR
jgi:cell wall-associated NlpC family hydrolase